MNREKMLGNMEVKKLLIKLSIPAIMGMAMNALYNFVDTLFVAQGAAEHAIGGLTFALPIQMISTAVGLMIGVGSASVFSRAFGRGDREKMDQAVNTALRIDFIIALIFSILGFIFVDELLVFFGADASNIGFGKDYLTIILFGLLFQTMSMVLNNLTRAEGRPNLAMMSLIIGTGLNILLDPIFIFDFGFGLGVKGAAIATVISQFVAFIFIFTQSIAPKSSLHINLKKIWHIDWSTTKETISVGMPTFLRNATGAILAIIIFKLIDQYAGSDSALYVDIYGVINRVIMFVFLPAFGIVQGMVPIVGFNFGAKNHQRLKDVITYATKIIIIYFVIGFILIQLFASSVFSIFTKEHNQLFIDLGSQAFRVVSYGFILVGFQIIVSAIFQAFGFPIRAMIATISRQIMFFIPLAYLLTYLFGIAGIWYAFAAADLLSGLISIALLYFEMKSIGRLAAKFAPDDLIIYE
ncbi:MAG: MATE family efflux transporter [Firmicutes bacterium]|nr:MATE family efflux transporter [Bacillota bacterium]